MMAKVSMGANVQRTGTTLKLSFLLDGPNLQSLRVLFEHLLVVVLCSVRTVSANLDTARLTWGFSVGTFQNCFEASLPATRFKIFAPPGCSSTNPLVTVSAFYLR